MASTKWWEELIDFSKNFDDFRRIDLEQKRNIIKKLQKLEPSSDLHPYPIELHLSDLYSIYISVAFNRLCWNHVVGKELFDKEKEQLKYIDNKKVKFLTYCELEDLLEDICTNHTQYNGKLKKLEEIKVDRREFINFSDYASLQCIGFVFPNAITCSDELGEVDLRYSIFLKICDFCNVGFLQYTYFNGATFSKTAYFIGAKFSQIADFRDATFSGSADFSGATFLRETVFSEKADFRKAKFSENANFSGTTFSQIADFRESKFSEKADFSNARFSQDAYFRGAIFLENADFKEAKFCGHSYFNNSEFKRGAYFQKVIFSEWVPEFFDAELKEDTSFFGVNWLKKVQDKEKADIQARTNMQARAYEILFLIKEISISLIKETLKKKEAQDKVQAIANMRARAYEILFLIKEIYISLIKEIYISLIKETLKRKEAKEKAKEKAEAKDKEKDKEKANMQARAYERLYLIMETLKRKDDKLFFFTKKMKIQRLLEKGFIYNAFNCFYEETSNYGNSLTRALSWFVGTGILFGYFYYLMIYLCSSCLFAKVNYSFEAFKISLSNMLFFSSLLGLQDKNGYLESTECVTELIKSNIFFSSSGIFQIFLSAILLFLLILTLRNKFRTFK